MLYFCAALIVFSVVVIVVGIIKLHELPGKIAKDRGHPQAEAIRICSLLGLLIFPFWMIALLWAYTKPMLQPIALDRGTTTVDGAPEPFEGEPV
jgi:uncharacterized membrane protein